PRRGEVTGEELAHLLRVARLRHRREADEVGEEDRDEPTLGKGRVTCGRGRGLRQRRSARPAEALVGWALRAAARTPGGERAAAVGAEPVAERVLAAAARAVHGLSLIRGRPDSAIGSAE